MAKTEQIRNPFKEGIGEKVATLKKSYTSPSKPKETFLKKASDFSERFLLRPWAGNAANFLIHSGENIGEGLATLDPNVRKYANEPGVLGSSGQKRVRDIASEAGKSALDLSTFATGGSTAAIGAATKAPTLLKTFIQGAKVGGAYGLAGGAAQALGGQQKLASLDTLKQVGTGGLTGAVAGGTLAAGGQLLGNALTKKAAGRITPKAPGDISDTATTASTYVSPPALKGKTVLDKNGNKLEAVALSNQPSLKTVPGVKEGINQSMNDVRQAAQLKVQDPTTYAAMVKKGLATEIDPVRLTRDMAAKLETHKAGLGKQFIEQVSGKNFTPDQLATAANKLVDGSGAIKSSPLLTEARKYKSAEEFAKVLKAKVEAPGVGEKTLNPLKGTYELRTMKTKDISFGGQAGSAESIRSAERAIKEGTTLPPITVNPKGSFALNEVIDGNHRLTAYKNMGVDEIQVLVKTSDKGNGISNLTSIWEEANKAGKQIINAGGKTTAKQNEQLQSVIDNIRKGAKASPIKERGFITTLKGAKSIPKEAKAILSGSYVPKTNAETANAARALVGADPIAAEAIALNPRNAVDVEVGNQLIPHYAAVGNHAKVAEIGNAMAVGGTELGQTIQAFANYDKTTPQGAIRFAQSQINKHNALGKNVVKISDAQVKSIYDAAAAIQALPMGRERNIAASQLIDEVNNLIPSSVADKAITIWKAGLLTSMRTTERNLVGNTIMAGAERAKDLPATAADMIMSRATGKRTLTSTQSGTLKGAKTGWQAAVDIVRTGYDPEQAINKYDVRHVTWKNTPVEQGLKKYTDIVFRSLGAQDKVFYNSAYARSLYDQAGAEAINAGQRGNKAFIENLVRNPNDHMLQNAVLDANMATFKDKNVISNIINQAKQAMSKSEWSKIGGEIVAPFTGVPSSILGKMVDYSPIGFANGVRHAGQVTSGRIPQLQRQAAQEIGRGTVGSALFAIGAYLSSKGLLTGQAKDLKEAKQWELQGKKANSVKVGNQWYSLQSIGPQTLILLAGAKAKKELGAGGGGLAAYGASVGKDFLGQSFLAGVQGPLNAVTDPARYGQSYLKSQTASIVPNIVKDSAKAFDKNQRETNSVGDALKASIPGLRNTLLPKRDVLGNVLPNDVAGASAFIDLFNSSTERNTPVINELSRLNDAGFNATPTTISKNISVGKGKNKQNIKLTPSEINTLSGNISSELQDKLDKMISTNKYKNSTDEEKSKAIGDLITKVRASYKSDTGRELKNTEPQKKRSILDIILGVKEASAAELPKATDTKQKLANAIATYEGYKKTGTLADRQRNPGNLRFAGQKNAVRGDKGFAKFKTHQDGFNALVAQIKLDSNRNLTLRQFIYKYAPPKENNTAAYLRSVSKTLGISPDTKLKAVIK